MNWSEILTPIHYQSLQNWLQVSRYDETKASELIQGFRDGFDIGYRGPMKRKNTAKNLLFQIGDKFELWNKVMKEVKLG